MRQTKDGSFQNTSQLLLVSQQSVADLNKRLPPNEKIDHRPFRANLIVSGNIAPYAEDAWQVVRVRARGVALLGNGKCNRCQMINISPTSAAASREPLRTLALYRRARGLIAFGLHLGQVATSAARQQEKQLAVGDELLVAL